MSILKIGASAPAINSVDQNKQSISLEQFKGKKVVGDYGVWGLKKFMGKEYMGISRTTFVIDEKGIIEDIITKVDTKEHTTQILKQ